MNIGSVVAQFKSDLSDFKAGLSNAKSELREAANDMSQNMQKVGGAVKGVGEKMTLFATTPIVGFGLAAVKSAADMEQLEVAFTTMLGSADKARAMLGELTEFAATTPFQLGDVQNAAKSLLAYGIEAKNIEPTLRAIGDVASGTNTPIKEMASLFGKMSSSGIIFTEDLNQLTDRGIPVLSLLAEKFDTNVVGVRKMASEGKISFNDINDAFNTMSGEGGQFFNLMQEQSKKTSGQFSNLQDSVAQLGREIGKDLLPYVNQFIQYALKLVDRFRALSPETKKWIMIAAGVVAVVGPILIVVGSLISAIGAIIPVIMFMAGALAAITAPALLTVAAIAAVIAIGVALYKNWDKVIGIFNDVKTAFQVVIDVFRGYDPGALMDDKTWSKFKDFSNMLTGIRDTVLGFGNDVRAGFENAVNGVTSFFTNTAQTIYDVINGILQLVINGDFTGAFGRALGLDEDSPIILGILNLRRAIIDGWNAIMAALTNAYNFVSNIVKAIASVFTWIYSNVIEPVLMLISAIILRIFYEIYVFITETILIPLYNFFVEKFEALYTFLVDVLTRVWNFIVVIWTQISEWLKNNLLIPLFNFIVSWLTNNLNKTIEIFTKIKNFLQDTWNYIYNNIIAPVSQAIYNFVSGIWNSISNFTASTWNSIKSTISNLFNQAKNQVQDT
jgi:tape measure domain-containing protein